MCYQDFMTDSTIFDTALHENFLLRAHKQGGEERNFLLQYTCKEFLERLSYIKRDFRHVLELYGYDGLWARSVADCKRNCKVSRVESLEIFCNDFPNFYLSSREDFSLKFSDVDFIFSPLSLHLRNNFLQLLRQIKDALVPDGLFMGLVLGTESLRELREVFLQAEMEIYNKVSPHVAPFIDIKDAGACLQRAGFALPVVDREDIDLTYKDLFCLMRDLKSMGMQNCLFTRRRTPLSRRFFARANALYHEKFSENGRIKAHFSFLWLTGWSPSPLQQKPLKPGSGQLSLANFLNTI